MAKMCWYLLLVQDKIPSKIRSPFPYGEATMIDIMSFHPAKISFECVRCVRNVLVMEIVEHVRECMPEHSSRPFQITHDPTGLCGRGDGMTESSFPRVDFRKEVVSFFVSVNFGYPEKELAQCFSCDSLGLLSAPHETLSLDVD